MLQIGWRRWLTRRYVGAWLADRAYFRLQLQGFDTDNPDQRIAEDLRSFTAYVLSLSLGLLTAVVSLFSFLFILWGLSGPAAIPLGPLGIGLYPGLSRLGGAALCRLRHLAHHPDRPAAGAAQFRAAALRGGFPL